MTSLPDPASEPAFDPERSSVTVARPNGEIVPFTMVPIGAAVGRGVPLNLVQGFLSEGALAVIYGPPGTGKTFLTLDLLCSIGAGKDWMGHKTLAGWTFYVGLEGFASLPDRVLAWKKNYAADPKAVRQEEPFDFFGVGHVDRLIAAVKETTASTGIPARAIAIDTLSRAIPGQNENDQAIMSSVVAACDRIRDETGAALILVHHTGHQSTLPRGSSVLLGAIDTSLYVRRSGKSMTVSVEKQRQGRGGNGFTFRLSDVEIGDGINTRQSAVAVLASAVHSQPTSRTNDDDERLLVFLEERTKPSPYAMASKGEVTSTGIKIASARKQAMGSLFSEEASEDAKRQRFNRGLRRLTSAGKVLSNGEFLTIPSPDGGIADKRDS